MVKASTRILGAVTLALNQNAALLDGGIGLQEVTITVKFDRDGMPQRAILTPTFSCFLRAKPIGCFTFDTT